MNLHNMVWFNEPEEHTIESNTSISISVTAKTDFWRQTHYGFIVDDGPFLCGMVGGEFEMTAKVLGNYKSRFDQAGLMVRTNQETWIKSGVEFVEGKLNLSTVATLGHSDWSVIPLDTLPEAVWIKIVRRGDTVETRYSLDGKTYYMMRLCYFPSNVPVKVGPMAASPDGTGFRVRFEEFDVKHLPDQGRQLWLQQNP